MTQDYKYLQGVISNLYDIRYTIKVAVWYKEKFKPVPQLADVTFGFVVLQSNKNFLRSTNSFSLLAINS